MNPNGDPTHREAEDRQAAADREALRDLLLELGLGAILLMAAIGLAVVGWPVIAP